MKRFIKNKKNIILSLIFAFMVFLGIGVSIHAKKASAEIPDIYTVPTANFFNIEGNYDLVKTSGTQIVLKFDVSYDSNFNGFRIEILENINSGYLKFALYSLNDNGGALPDLNIPGYYSFSSVLRDENNSVVDNGCNIAFSSTIDSSVSNTFPILNNNYAYVGQNSSGTVDFSRGVKYVEFTFGTMSASGLQGSASYTAGEVFYICDICVNYGQENQPYQPYYYRGIVDDDSSSDDGAYSDGYSDGYSAGYDEGYSDGYSAGYDEGILDNSGYDEGYADGIKQAQYGFFSDVDVTLHIEYTIDDNGNTETDSFPADYKYVYGGISLSPSYLNYNPNYEDYVVSSWVTFSWSDSSSAPLLSNFSLKASGSTLLYSSLDDPTGWPVTVFETGFMSYLQWSNPNSSNPATSPYYLSELVAPSGYVLPGSFVVKSVKTGTFTNLDYLKAFTLTVADISYQGGYSAGVVAGDEVAYNKGLEEGKIIGKDEGFKLGLQQGISDDPYSLGEFMYTYLDMPGRILSNWLNFEFMGLNLMGLVTFLLSIALVAFVLKKVV